MTHTLLFLQEITGELPPETPLGPCESPPRIRRKVRTEFTITDKLLVEPTSEEEEKLSKLELDFEIQSKIVTASLKLMNEPGLKRRIRKQRKVNYDAAQIRLTKIEQELIEVRKKLQQDSKLKYRTKKQLIEEHLSPSFKSVTHVTPLVTRIPASVLHSNNCIVNGNKNLTSSMTDGTNGSIHIKEMPLSSLVEQRVVSSSKEGISKSRAKKRGKLMMNGMTTGTNSSSSQMIATNSTTTTTSSGVTSSAAAAMKSSNRVYTACQSVPSSPLLTPRYSKCLTASSHDVSVPSHGINLNHHRQDNLPSETSIGFIHQRSYSQGLPCKNSNNQTTTTSSTSCSSNDTHQIASLSSSSPTSILKNKSQTAPSTPLKSKVKNIQVVTKGETLTRSNSLENVRRKSYISAVLSPAAVDYPFNGTHFYNPSIHGTKTVPRNPPPPPPVNTTSCMAKRPLPPTPSTIEVKKDFTSSSSSSSQDVHFKIPHDSSSTRNRRRYDSGQSTSSNGTVDISSRAVRSSVIRTPLGIAISTTSSADASVSSSSSNGIISNVNCTDSNNTALTCTDTCMTGSIVESSAHIIIAPQQQPARSASSSDSPSPSPILKGRSHRSRAYSNCILGPPGMSNNDLSDSTPQLSSSHSCCSSRSASNAPSPTPSSASALALQQQCSSITFAPVNVSSYDNLTPDLTNHCHFSHPQTLDIDNSSQVKEVTSNMEKIVSVNYCTSNSTVGAADINADSINLSNTAPSSSSSSCLASRKSRKSHNVPRSVISPINCTLAESIAMAKPPLTPLSIVSSQSALDNEVEATFTNASHCESVSVISSVSRSCIETPRPDPIPILPHVNSAMVDVVAVGTYTPQWEEEKPFEFSDFIKYSAKHRAKQQGKTCTVTTPISSNTCQHSTHQKSTLSHINQGNFEASPCSTPVSVDAPVTTLNETTASPAAPHVAGEFNREMIDWYEEHLNKATVV